MQNVENLCLGCMKDNGGADTCPFCGYHDDHLQTAPFMPPKVWLENRYLVGKLISNDGEGATYMGWDNTLQAPIYIREFLPTEMIDRRIDALPVDVKPQFKASFDAHLGEFLALSRDLGRMRELPALIPVYDIFEANGTGYRISEYTESITFEDFLARNGNVLTFEQTRQLLMPALGTLSALHNAGICHGGISPKTLLITREGKIKFSAFAVPALRDKRSDLRTELFAGYSAIEQYGFEGKKGPQTDIYAFAAVIYRALVGENPPVATERASNDSLTIPAAVTRSIPRHALVALANALQVMPADRTSSAEELRNEFSSSAPVSTIIDDGDDATDESEDADGENEMNSKGRGVTYALVAMIVTVIVLAVLYIFVLKPYFAKNPEPTPEPSTISTDTALSYVDSGKTRKVDDITGIKYTDAVSKYGSIYNLTVSEKKYSTNYAAGEIMEQSVKAGTDIPADKSADISVVVSLGPSTATIPDLSGKSYEEAALQLVSLGFSPANISKYEKYSDSVKYGKVIEIDPPIGTKNYDVNMAVKIYVSNAQESSVPAPKPSESKPTSHTSKPDTSVESSETTRVDDPTDNGGDGNND